jgi:hypothetical protein
MKKNIKNMGASVNERLLQMAREKGLDFQRLLTQYALERLVHRISVSRFSEEFILKGAILLTLWFEQPYRRTRDLDLLGTTEPIPENFAQTFYELCEMEVPDDGVVFLKDTITAKRIREDNEFGGVRVLLKAQIANALLGIQIDIGFGDAAVPEPEVIDFPTLLPEFAVPHLRAYQKETTIAEKFHALVTLERTNSRMKDFFDLYTFSREFAFTGERLLPAIHDAFERRGTPIPEGAPDGLTEDFANDPQKQMQWKGFLRQNVAPPLDTLTLAEVVAGISDFLTPLLVALRDDQEFKAVWNPGGPWTPDNLKPDMEKQTKARKATLRELISYDEELGISDVGTE